MYNQEKGKLHPEVSVVIVNYNTMQLLRDCLQSLTNAASNLKLKTIVVDNCSTDGSLEMCENEFPEVRLIKNSKNKGFGRANNQGILVSNSQYVLLLNSDTIVPPVALDKMLDVMCEDSSIGILGCRLINADGSYQPSCMKFPSLRQVFAERLLLYKMSNKLPRGNVEPPYLKTQTECDWVVGACMLIRRKAIEVAGLFDPNIWMYGEEMELCFRIKAAGWRIMFDPNVCIAHLQCGSWNNKGYSPTLLKMNGMLYFYRKHHSFFAYTAICMLTAIGAVLRLFIWGAICLCKGTRRQSVVLEIKSNLKVLMLIIGFIDIEVGRAI